MADQRIQHTEEMVGYGHASKSDTLNRLVMVQHNNDGTHEKLDVGSGDADGDIYYRASGALARKAIGSSNQMLVVSSGTPTWQTNYALKGTGASTGFIVGATQVQITYGDEASHIKVQGVSKFNGLTVAISGAFTKDEATGNFLLSTNGNTLTIAAAPFNNTYPGSVVSGILSSSIAFNTTGTALTCRADKNGDTVDINFYDASSGWSVDLTTLVTTGKYLYVHICTVAVV